MSTSTSRERAFFGEDQLQYEGSSSQGGWIVSYADMMTIILTFFILLLSISTIAQTKYELLVQAFTGEKAGNLQEVKQEIDKIIEEQQLGGEMTTKLDLNGLTIEFSNALLFESGDAVLKPSGVAVFKPIEAHLVKNLGGQYGLVIEGYTDDVPISNDKFKSNWELSTARAIHVMERMSAAGMDARRISVQGFANTRPATDIDISNHAAVEALPEADREKARAANRRVIVRIDGLAPGVLERIKRDARPASAGDAAGGNTTGGTTAGGTTAGGTTAATTKDLKPFELPRAKDAAKDGKTTAKQGKGIGLIRR